MIWWMKAARASQSVRVLLITIGVSGVFLVQGAPGSSNLVSYTPFSTKSPLHSPDQILERTCFQTVSSYNPRINIGADVAIVYGISRNLPDRVDSWRRHGYRVHLMTGVAWGHYQDYLYGKFDGRKHLDEAQTDRNGKKISHGGDVYYMCPTESYDRYLAQGVVRALKSGVLAVHLEEPEFWVRGGYSPAFQREWARFYGERWQPPHQSVDARWRCAKLKYWLYRRALSRIFVAVADYNRRHGTAIRCYVPTHSLLNYAHWRIVSPESSLTKVPGCDGYIAQVWTGTARTPNVYHGRLRQRTFDTAYLEYGVMMNLVRATGRRVWFLHDPVEDNPNHDWTDYRQNWEATVVASLLHPDVWRYEVMPWPQRVFSGRYPRNLPPQQRRPIPSSYAMEIQAVIYSLNRMGSPEVRWDCGTEGVGVLVSDSLMFERGEPSPSDPHLSHVYGLLLPLLKHGIPVTPVQLENVPIPDYLKPYRLLLLTYQGMKPLRPEVHKALAQWVRSGGGLIVWDDDSDPYNQVREWWNTNQMQYPTPRLHLFDQLGIGEVEPGGYSVGKGFVYWVKANPVRLAYEKEGDLTLLRIVRKVAGRIGLRWRETSYLLVRRGPWIIGAGLEETDPDLPIRTLHGQFLSLFDLADPKRRFVTEVPLQPGRRVLLLDLNRPETQGPTILVASARVTDLSPSLESLECKLDGVEGTPCFVAARIPGPPRRVLLNHHSWTDFQYDPEHHILWIQAQNHATPQTLRIEFSCSLP